MTPRSAEHGTHHLDAVYDAVLFDMDGVVTNTAAIHAAAWKQLFDEVLRDPRVQVDDPETTFDPAADWTVESNPSSANLGWSVASAGDVNGDGYGDLIHGTPSYDNSSGAAGAAFVHLGNEGRGSWTGPARQLDPAATDQDMGTSSTS